MCQKQQLGTEMEIKSHQPPRGACVGCPSLGDHFGLKYSQNKALGQGQP